MSEERNVTAEERNAAIRARFDERAESYDEHLMHRELAAAVAAFVDRGTDSGGAVPDGAVSGGASSGDAAGGALDAGPGSARTVLDVATGTGLVLRALAARHPEPGLALIGVDLSPGMLAVARRELPQATFLEGVAEELPVPDAAADLVTCVTALHVFAHPLPVFEEFARVLAPEGVLVVATFAEPPAGHGHGPGHGTPAPDAAASGAPGAAAAGATSAQAHGPASTPPAERPPGAAGAPGYEPNHAPFQTAEALAATAAPAGFVLTRFEYRTIEDDRVLIAELAPVD